MIWKPDTCQCSLEYTNSNTPEDFIGAEMVCDQHKAVPVEDLPTVILEENQRRMLSVLAIVDLFPRYAIEDNDGNKDIDMSKFLYSFDKDRNLNISVVGLTPLEKIQAQEAVLLSVSDKVILI